MTKITWIPIFATVFQLLSSTAGTCDFQTPVGIRNELQVVSDGQMTSSTHRDADSVARFGRLQGANAWCPNVTDADPYLQIDLGQSYVICAVEVQGEPGASVNTTFTLKSSIDNATYFDVDGDQVFNGSAANGDTADFHTLSSTITARYIRFKPGNTSICLRVEIYGTPENVDVTCNEYEILVVATGLADTTGLSLADVGCLPNASDASSANFTITLGQCDTTLTISSDEKKSFYRNKIFRNSNGTTLFNIICSYIRTPKTASDDGSFSFSFGIFEDDAFQTAVNDSQIALNRTLYFKVEVESLDTDLELHLTKCWTTPTAIADSNGVTFLESGCPVPGNINIAGYNCSRTDTKQSFSLQAFRFFTTSSGSKVYFHCNVLVCLNSNPSSLCKSQCTPCSSRKRKRRDVKEDTDEEVHLVIGPFTIKHNDEGSNDVEDKEDGKDPTLIVEDSENFPVTWLIIICVCASVAMAIIIGLLVAVKLSQSARGPAVKDVTADLARDNLAFDELDIKTLSMKSMEQEIKS